MDAQIERRRYPATTPNQVHSSVSRRRRALREGLDAGLFLLPKALVFIGFVLIPFVYTFVLMFQMGTMLLGFHFVGLRNFKTIFRDGLFFSTIGHTFLFAVISIPLSIFVPLAVGLFFTSEIRGIKIYRVLIYFPSLMSVVVTGVVWNVMLDPNGGPVYKFFNTWLHLNIPFLSNGFVALVVIALISVWQGTGFNAIIFMAGLNDIPRSLLEAARIDGSTDWGVFWRIKLPLLKPIIQLVLVLTTIGSIQVFDIVYVLTQGGPGTSTFTVMWYIYQNVFQGGAVGYAAVMGVLMLVFTLFIAALYMRGTRSEGYHE